MLRILNTLRIASIIDSQGIVEFPNQIARISGTVWHQLHSVLLCFRQSRVGPLLGFSITTARFAKTGSGQTRLKQNGRW